MDNTKQIKIMCIEKLHPQYLRQIEVGNQYTARLSRDSVSPIIFVSAGKEEIPVRYYKKDGDLFKAVEAVFRLVS